MIKQTRTRWLWVTLETKKLPGGLLLRQVTAWLSIGGRKPLADLPRWRRHLFHLPSIRWRLL
jgi:hypothetical protein